MQESEKGKRLVDLLRQVVGKKGEEKKCLVFFNSKSGCDRAKQLLRSEELPAFVISGSMEQADREQSLSAFHKAAPPTVLLATDVAQRGLHISDLTLVVNYDFPKEIESYTHRIGRTGRAGQIGDAHSFVTSYNRALVPHLIKVIKEAGMKVDDDLTVCSASHPADTEPRSWCRAKGVDIPRKVDILPQVESGGDNWGGGKRGGYPTTWLVQESGAASWGNKKNDWGTSNGGGRQLEERWGKNGGWSSIENDDWGSQPAKGNDARGWFMADKKDEWGKNDGWKNMELLSRSSKDLEWGAQEVEWGSEDAESGCEDLKTQEAEWGNKGSKGWLGPEAQRTVRDSKDSRDD